MADGEPVQQVQLAEGGLSAAIISYGAALQQLYLDGCDYSLVLGFNDFASYQRYSQHYGANCGRVANRIAGARLHLAGRDYQLDNNFLGKHCLHSGKQGYSKRNWNLLDYGDDYARLELVDPDGCGGFPGTVRVRCEYRLSAPATLQLTLSAEAQADTVCNLAHHSYFCLDASGDIRDHRFSIAADSYLPVDADLIPTGAVAPVVGTDYDLRQARSLRAAIAAGVVYDHNYCLADKRRQLSEVAQVSSANSGLACAWRAPSPVCSSTRVIISIALSLVSTVLFIGRSRDFAWSRNCGQPLTRTRISLVSSSELASAMSRLVVFLFSLVKNL